MVGSIDTIQGFKKVLYLLLTRTRSQQAGLIMFLFIGLSDFVFRIYLYPIYISFLTNLDLDINLINIDVVFAPIVWLSFFAIILGSLTIVITFAAQNVPKLIDLYMDNWPSLLFVWWATACLVHSLTIKVLSESEVEITSSLIFNFHFLLSISLVIGFPFIFSILRSTKTSNVIENILQSSYSSINRLIKKGAHAKFTEDEIAKIQYNLFEELNQLVDLLIYEKFKEPKAQVIEGIGSLVGYYVENKTEISESFFVIQKIIKEDISFRTMKSLLEEVENSRTFYEQKSFRLIGNIYNIFLDTGEFDLSTLCVEQLSQLGKKAVEKNDQALVELITIRLNTYFRFSLKHGQHHNEPRNLYNLVFHYGQFIDYLIENNEVERIKKCIEYFVFYGQQCFNAISRATALSFILDAIASEMQKNLMKIFANNWDREIQQEMLTKFLLFDNFKDMNRDFAIQFFSKNHGIRLLHIGLALFYLNHGEDQFAEIIAKDTLQDFELMGENLFLKTMTAIFARIEVSGPKFWEDTDRGNINIYFSQYQSELEKFKQIQDKLLRNIQKIN